MHSIEVSQDISSRWKNISIKRSSREYICDQRYDPRLYCASPLPPFFFLSSKKISLCSFLEEEKVDDGSKKKEKKKKGTMERRGWHVGIQRA